MSTSSGPNLFYQLGNRQSDPNVYKFQPNLFRERLRLAKNLYKTNLIAHYGCVNAIEFSNGGKYLVSGGDDKRVILWDLEKSIAEYEKPVSMDKEHQSNIFCLGFDKTNSKIFSGGNDELVIVHDFETKKVIDVFMHHKPVYGLSIDPSCDSLLATACEDGKITIYDQRKGAAVQVFGKFGSRQASYHAVQFHPIDGNFVVTANTRKGAAFWDLRSSNRPVIQYGGEENQQSCMSVRFSSNGNLVLALRRRLPPILYNTFSQKPICQFYHPDYYNSCTMKSCCFAGPDEEYVLSGSDDFNLYVWKVGDVDLSETNQLIESTHMVLCGHRSIVNQVRYNQEKCLIASSGVEKVVKLWSPFNQKNWSGDFYDEISGIDSSREVFSHDAYVSLVNANMSHDYSTQNTQEDSRMMAFFDSLIQQEIEGWNTNYSSDSEQNSIPSSGQSTRHNSSSDDSDDNSRTFYFSNSRDRSRRGLNVNPIKPQRTKYTNRIAYLIATKRNTLRRLALKGASNSNRRRRQNSLKTKRKNTSTHHRSACIIGGQNRTTRNGHLSSKRSGRYASSMSFRNRILATGLAGTSTRDENELHGLKNTRHKRNDAIFRALRRKHRSRRQINPSDTSSEEDNSDVKFNFETVRTTNLAIPSTSTGITSSGRDIITRLRQQEQLLDSDSGDDDEDNENVPSSSLIINNTNQRNQTPPTNGLIKNNHINNREHETEENASSTSSSFNQTNHNEENHLTSDTNDSGDNNGQSNNTIITTTTTITTPTTTTTTNNNNNNNNSSIVVLPSTTNATESTTINNRKRCHAINLDIYSSHSNSRLSNSSYLEDDINSNSNESLDCFINKKIKINKPVPEYDESNGNGNNLNLSNNQLISEIIKTPNGNKQNINNNNNNDDIHSNSNYLNTPDSGISLATSSAGCSSTSSRKKTLNHLNTISLNASNNNNLQNGDKFSIKLFHQKVARVRRNYRKKFGDDSESD